MYYSATHQPLTDEILRRRIPSAFALEPWQERSDRYRFIPTINVINALRDTGYNPVSAIQSRSRIPGKQEYTKHMIRFRSSQDLGRTLQVDEIIPEIVLINSHDGTSAYKLMLGLFRCFCSNQCVVQDATLDQIRVRHTGKHDLCQQVIDVSAEIIDETPRLLETVHKWEQTRLPAPDQQRYAQKALEYYDSAIEVTPEKILQPRRRVDAPDDQGARSLWTTFNIVQENLIKGRIYGRNSKGYLTRTREIKSVDRNVKLNRQLWELASTYATNEYGAPTVAPVIEEAQFTSQSTPTAQTPFEQAQALIKRYGANWAEHTHELTV